MMMWRSNWSREPEPALLCFSWIDRVILMLRSRNKYLTHRIFCLGSRSWVLWLFSDDCYESFSSLSWNGISHFLFQFFISLQKLKGRKWSFNRDGMPQAIKRFFAVLEGISLISIDFSNSKDLWSTFMCFLWICLMSLSLWKINLKRISQFSAKLQCSHSLPLKSQFTNFSMRFFRKIFLIRVSATFWGPFICPNNHLFLWIIALVNWIYCLRKMSLLSSINPRKTEIFSYSVWIAESDDSNTK